MNELGDSGRKSKEENEKHSWSQHTEPPPGADQTGRLGWGPWLELSRLSPPEPSVASEGHSRTGPEEPGKQDPVHQFLPCGCSGPKPSYPSDRPRLNKRRMER